MLKNHKIQTKNKINILLVETDKNLQSLSEQVFDSNKFSLTIENSVPIAINRLGTKQFDFVILESNLGCYEINDIVPFIKKHNIDFGVFKTTKDVCINCQNKWDKSDFFDLPQYILNIIVTK